MRHFFCRFEKKAFQAVKVGFWPFAAYNSPDDGEFGCPRVLLKNGNQAKCQPKKVANQGSPSAQNPNR
jgi:hypothetical protein